MPTYMTYCRSDRDDRASLPPCYRLALVVAIRRIPLQPCRAGAWYWSGLPMEGWQASYRATLRRKGCYDDAGGGLY